MGQKQTTHSSQAALGWLLPILGAFGWLVWYRRRVADGGHEPPQGIEPMQKTSDETALAKLENALKWSREEERHEIDWIGHRLGWMLISQSFLITAAIYSGPRKLDR